MHLFPKDEQQRKQCVKFVRKHRPEFTQTTSSTICSAHFEDSCFEIRNLLGVPNTVKPKAKYLIHGAVPTKEIFAAEETKNMSSREKRKVCQ